MATEVDYAGAGKASAGLLKEESGSYIDVEQIGAGSYEEGKNDHLKIVERIYSAYVESLRL